MCPWAAGGAGASSGGSAGGSGDGSHVIICSAAGVGCSGRLRLLLTWRCASQAHPDISADLALDPLQVASCSTLLLSLQTSGYNFFRVTLHIHRCHPAPCRCLEQYPYNSERQPLAQRKTPTDSRFEAQQIAIHNPAGTAAPAPPAAVGPPVRMPIRVQPLHCQIRRRPADRRAAPPAAAAAAG